MSLPLTGLRSQRGGVLAKLLLVLLVVLAAGTVLWITFLPSLVVSRIQARTGFSVRVDHLSVNPFTANVAIKGLVVKNPATWPREEFVELREFHADADLFSLFGSRLVADEVVVDVAQVTLVRNQQGITNAAAFQEALTKKAGAPAGGTKQGTAKQAFLIKHLVLKFDKLVYADYSSGSLKGKEYNLNINREMRDVDSVTKLVSPFTGSALGLVTGALSGIFPKNQDLLKSLTETLQDAGAKTGEKLKGLLDSLDKKKP